MFQFLFKRILSGKQWLSLFILTLGCMLQSLDVSQTDKSSNDESKTEPSDVTWWILIETSTGVILILVQVNQWFSLNRGAVR